MMSWSSDDSSTGSTSLIYEHLVQDTWDQEFMIMRDLEGRLSHKIDMCAFCFKYSHRAEECRDKTKYCSKCGQAHNGTLSCFPMCKNCYALGMPQGHFECPARYKALKKAYLKQLGVPREDISRILKDSERFLHYVEKYRLDEKAFEGETRFQHDLNTEDEDSVISRATGVSSGSVSSGDL